MIGKLNILMGVAILTSLIYPSISIASTEASSAHSLTQEDVNDLNQNQIADVDPDDELDDQMEDWLAERDINLGKETSKGRLYYSSMVDVSVKPSNHAWVKARSIAFSKAILEIRSEFIKNQFGRSIAKVERSIEGDESSNNHEFKDESLNGKSRISAIWDKSLALGEEKLNQLLFENGIDPTELNSLPPAKRKDLYMEKFITNILTRAAGNSSGIITTATFESNNSKGKHAIGVIAYYSPKLKQLAYDIAHGIEPSTSGKKGRKISDRYNYTPKVKSTIFGLRVAVAEDGQVGILSFGQWGYSFQGKNERRKDRSRKMAKRQADQIAVSQITNFVNSSLSLSNSSTIGEIIETYLSKQGNDINEDDIVIIVDKISSHIKQQSSASISGIRTVDRWKYKHPYGHEIVGRVKLWTLKNVKSAQAIKNFKPSSTAKRSSSSITEPSIKNNVYESPDFPDDF